MKQIGLIVAFFAAIGLLVWLALSIDVSIDSRGNGTKRLSTSAEGFSCHVHGEHFPRISFDSCKLGKLKAGVFSLSAFDVVECENLIVNLPPTLPNNTAQRTESAAEDSVVDMVKTFGLDNLTRLSGRDKAKKINLYGLKIKKFTLNKMTADGLVPQLSAETIKNSGRKIIMTGVLICREEGIEHVANAELVTKPTYAIVWPGGRIELPQLGHGHKLLGPFGENSGFNP